MASALCTAPVGACSTLASQALRMTALVVTWRRLLQAVMASVASVASTRWKRICDKAQSGGVAARSKITRRWCEGVVLPLLLPVDCCCCSCSKRKLRPSSASRRSTKARSDSRYCTQVGRTGISCVTSKLKLAVV
ncbi:hypothetical protein D9M68_772980 [compost metagenome]